MHDFEEELKGRFKDAASTEGVDADKLWAGILQELPHSPVPPPEKKRNRSLWLSLLFLLVLAGLFFFSFPGKSDQTAVGKATPMAQSPAASTSTLAPSTEQPVIPTPSSLQTTTKLNETTGKQQLADANNKENKQSLQYDKKVTKVKVLTTSKSNDPGIQTETSSSLQITNESQTAPTMAMEAASTNGLPDPSSTSEPRLLNTTTTTSNFLAKSTNEPVLIQAVLPLAYLENKKLFLPASPLHPEFSTPTLAAKQVTQNRFQLGVFTGLQYWSDTYAQDEDLGKTLSDTYTSQPGYSVSLELGYQYKPHLEIRSGIEYLHSYTQFNLIQTWDTIMFRNNVPGSELINAEAIRTVKHQNEQQILSIPFLVGTKLERGRFSLGVNAGLGLNFFLHQGGKSLNKQEVITSYEQNEGAEVPYTKFFWSAQLQAYAQYQLKNNMAVQIRPNLRWQAHGTSAFFGLKHQSLLSGLSIGLLF